MSSFITCVPASRVPPKPSSAHFHASGPRLTRNSETICWLPGGRKLVKSEIKSNRLVRPPTGLVATPTAISKVGKNARKRLNAMACEIMLQRGNPLPNMLSARFERAADAIIARHYTRAADIPNSRGRSRLPNKMFAARVPYAGRMSRLCAWPRRLRHDAQQAAALVHLHRQTGMPDVRNLRSHLRHRLAQAQIAPNAEPRNYLLANPPMS